MKKNEKPEIKWAVPEELGIPPDPVRLRLDFHHQACVMTEFEEDTVSSKVVAAMDVAQALASELSFGTGLLPPGAIWWRNTRSGPVFGIYVAPKVRKLALQQDIKQPAKRFTIPLPGLVFICSPGQTPWVYAVKKKPTKETDIVYHAPFCNIFKNGRSCPGSHQYPVIVADIPESFFTSFFSATADLSHRSERFPKNVIKLWEYIDKKNRYPLEDLVKLGTVHDIMTMEMGR